MEKIRMADLPPTPALAFLGDAVHSLYIRDMLVRQGIPKSGTLNQISLSYVTAEKQAETFNIIKDILTEEELDLCKRASNSSHMSKPRHASIADYRKATGFEAMLGMLHYLGDYQRIKQILDYAYTKNEKYEETNHDSEN